MKLLVLLLMLPGAVFADEAADRAEIARVIDGLNEARHPDVFAENASGVDIPARLRAGKPLIYSLGRGDMPIPISSPEIWSEKVFGWPAVFAADLRVVNAVVRSETTRLLTPDVAVVDGTFTWQPSEGDAEVTPLVFVMKRDGATWKIAVLRQVARE